LLVLCIVGAVCLLSVPADDSESWARDFLISKVVAVACLWSWYKLLALWESEDKLPELTDLLEEE